MSEEIVLTILNYRSVSVKVAARRYRVDAVVG